MDLSVALVLRNIFPILTQLAFTVTFDLGLTPNIFTLFIGPGFSVRFKMVLHMKKNRSSVRIYIRYLFLIERTADVSFQKSNDGQFLL